MNYCNERNGGFMKKKRLCSWILIMTLITCFAPGAAVSSFAAEPTGIMDEEKGPDITDYELNDIADGITAETTDDETSNTIDDTTDDITDDAMDDITDGDTDDFTDDSVDEYADESIFDDDVISSDDEDDLSEPDEDSIYDEEALSDGEVYLASEGDPSVTYELYVGGVQVTDANKNDITAAINLDPDKTAKGQAVYDSDTKTLTLTNFEFSGAGHEQYAGGYPECGAIWVSIEDFVLVLEGENTIAEAGGDPNISTSNGIFAYNNMTVRGTGNLTAKGGIPYPWGNGHGHSCGMNVYGNLLFDDDFTGILTCTSDPLKNNMQTYVTYALAGDNITVKNGTIKAYAGNVFGSFGYSMGILANGLKVYGGAIYASGGDNTSGTRSYGIFAPTSGAHFYGGEITATGKTLAIPHAEFDGMETVLASVNENGSESEDYSESRSGQYKYMNISFVEKFYDLYVGGVQVSNWNKNNLVELINDIGNSTASGLIVYEPNTNTIRFKNATLTGKGESDIWEGVKYVGSDTFNISAEGDNCIEDTGNRQKYSAAILFGEYNDYAYADNSGDVNVYVAENSKFILNGGNAGGDTYPASYGFCYQGSKAVKFTGEGEITLIGGPVETGYSYGMLAHEVEVDMDGSLCACSGDGYFSTGLSASSFALTSGTVTAESGSANESYGLYVTNWNFDKGLNIAGGDLSVIGGVCSDTGYGIYSDRAVNTNIIDGKLTVLTLSGLSSSSAWRHAPNIQEDIHASASKSSEGAPKEEYAPENNSIYKWFKAPDWGEIPDSFKKLFGNNLGNVPDGLWFVFGNDETEYEKYYTTNDTSIDYKMTYTGQAVTFNNDVIVFHGTRKLWNNRDYTITYKNNKTVASKNDESKPPMVIINGKGNYSKNASFTFDIVEEDINKAKLSSLARVSVNAGTKLSAVKAVLTFAGKNLSAGKDFDILYNGDEIDPNYKVKAGESYYLNLAGKGNFRGTYNTSIYVIGVDPKAKTYTLMSKVKIALPKAKDLPYDENGYKLAELFDNSGENEPKATVTNGKTALVYGTDFTVNSPDAKYGRIYDAGKHIVTVSGISKYNSGNIEGYVGDRNVTIEISGIPAGKVKVAGLATSVEYTGKQFTLSDLFNSKDKSLKEDWKEVTLFSGENVLTKNDDYDIEMNNNGSFGKFTVEFKLKGRYTGTIKKTITVKQGNLATATITAVDAEYRKTGAIPDTVIVKMGNTVLTEGIDYTLTYKNNTKISKPDNAKSAAVVTAKGIGNFKGSVSGTFKVNKADISKCVDLVAADKTYNTNAKVGYFKSEPKLQDGGKVISIGKNKDIEPIDKKTAFKYYYADTETEIPDDTKILDPNTVIEVRINVTCSEESPYKAGKYELRGRYKIINKGYDIKSAKVTVINPQKLVFNNGKAVVPLKVTDILVKMGTTELGTDDYEIVSIKNNRFLGTATVVIKGKGQYGGTKSFTFRISAKAIK